MARRSTAASDSSTTRSSTRTRKSEQQPGTAEVKPVPRPTTAAAPAPDGINTNQRSRGQPTVEEIRRRAYELYLARRGVGGTPESDWLQAERELVGKLKA